MILYLLGFSLRRLRDLSSTKLSSQHIFSNFQIRDIWNKIDPFSRVPGTNVEITENPDLSWRSQPRYHGIIWLRQLEVYVKFEDVDSLFERNIVYVTGDVVILNKRYKYKINDVGLSYCLRLLDSITETLKHCKSDV